MSTGESHDDEEENRRLRREYEALPKTPRHGEWTHVRHPEISPEWIMRIIESPHDRWQETTPGGELRTILIGRVPEFSQWIALVFSEDEITGALHTAFANRKLERKIRRKTVEERAVNPWWPLEALPEVIVLYTPEIEYLSIEVGTDALSRIHESESVAHGMVAHYDADGSLAAIDLESAELLLKPLLDAVLRREKEKTA